MFGLIPYDRDTDLFDMFDNFGREFHPDKKSICKTDIKDEGDKYVMEAELPGFNKEDIKLDINGDRLTLTAEHSTSDDEKDKNGKYIRRERSYSSYSRSFDISGIETDKITAEYKNGILMLNLPKIGEQPVQSRRLEIK